jgi:type II secretory pathway pseudopilin PulG
MTLVEMVLAAALLALVLAGAAGLYDHCLNEAKVQQVAALIHGLGSALAAYAEVTGAYPPGRVDEASDPALAALQTAPASAAQIQKVKSNLVFLSDGKWRCVDPWGRPLRYLTARSNRPEPRRRVEANGGVPIFESAGPDRDFGDVISARQADNICGDDPG